MGGDAAALLRPPRQSSFTRVYKIEVGFPIREWAILLLKRLSAQAIVYREAELRFGCAQTQEDKYRSDAVRRALELLRLRISDVDISSAVFPPAGDPGSCLSSAHTLPSSGRRDTTE